MSDSPSQLIMEQVVSQMAINSAKISAIYDILLRGLSQDDQNKVEAIVRKNTIQNLINLTGTDEHLEKDLIQAEDDYAAILKEIEDRPLLM